VANFGVYNFEGAVSGEVAPGLDVRLSGYDHNQDQGYYKNLTGGPSEGTVLHEWYVEGQVDYKPNDNTEFWVRAFESGWNDRGDAGARSGFVNGSWDETNLTDANGYPGAGLFVNPNYGYSGISGLPARGAVLANAGSAMNPTDAFFGQVPILGSTTLQAPGIFNNPSATNPNNFAAIQPRTVTLKNYNDANYVFTYHFPTVDFKYIGGFQGYQYDLNYSEPDTDVNSYVLPGNTQTCPTFSQAPFAGTPLSGFAALPCATAFPAASAASQAAGGPAINNPFAGTPLSTITINPLVHLQYEENDWWTSHEFSFSSTDNGPLQWIGGLYYYYQHYTNPISATAPLQPQFGSPISSTSTFAPAAANPNHYLFLQTYDISQSSIAAYGQVSYKISDTFKVTGNMRYTEDYKSGNEAARYVAFNNSLIEGLGPFLGAATPSLDVTQTLTCATGTLSNCTGGPLAKGVTSKGILLPNGEEYRTLGDAWGALTGGAGAEWTPTNDIFVYARYNRGYEEGTFNAGYVSANPEVGPEDINSYEVGYKQAFGHTASIDIAAFYYDYENLQLPISVANGGVTQSTFVNVPKSVSTGIEFEGNWSPITDLLLTFTYSYDYSAFETGCSLTAPAAKTLCVVDTNDPNAVAPGANPVPGQPAGTRNQSVKGNELPNAPPNKLAFNAAYTWHFEPGSLTLSGSYVWRDKQDGTFFERYYDEAPAWDDFDVRALWKGPNDKYEIIGYVKNIFNSLQYETGATAGGQLGTNSSVTTAALGLDPESVYTLAPPRTYGVEFRYKFF
jgi:iron complex outermembrane receptor protein